MRVLHEVAGLWKPVIVMGYTHMMWGQRKSGAPRLPSILDDIPNVQVAESQETLAPKQGIISTLGAFGG